VSPAEDRRHLPRPATSPRGAPTTFSFEGRLIRAFEGESVAVALWAAGIRVLARSPKYHRPRGLFCGAGHCGSCLVRIDGQPNLRACVVPVRPDLVCERQNVLPSAETDLGVAADLLFPKGLDHHTLATSSPLLNRLFLKLVRQMAGTGTLPDARPAPEAWREWPPVEDDAADVLVVGGGPAGLATAIVCSKAQPRARVVLVDDQRALGGSLLAEPGGAARAAALTHEAQENGATLWSGTAWLGAYPEDEPARGSRAPDRIPGVVALARARGLTRLSVRRIVFATGTYDQNLLFEDNDRPGVLAARAVGRLAFTEAVDPGEVVVVGSAAYGDTLVAGLRNVGVPVKRIAWERALPWRLGLRGSSLHGLRRRHERLACDTLAIASLPAPATEPLRQCGVPVQFVESRGGFVPNLTLDEAEAGRTSDPRLFVAGDVLGWRGPMLAEEHGRRVGQTVAGSL
jgi:sarcosine oxidase subunit alpha